MKFLTLVMSIGIISIVVFLFSVSVIGMIYEKGEIGSSLLDSVETISELKAERIGNFIFESEKDLMYLSQKKEVLEIFSSNFSTEVELLENKIKGISKNAARDMAYYLSENPEMTLEDLKNSEKFNEIAVQDVGETGYTYVNSRFEGILHFHPDPKARGLAYHAWKERFPNIWKYNEEVAQSIPCKDSYGFYDWKDIDGIVRKKFTYHSCINEQTKDNYSFYVGASTYLDELSPIIQFAGYMDEELLLFQNLNNYVDMNLINSNGEVIWTAEQKNDLGTNILTGRYSDTIFSNLYLDIKQDLKFKISNPAYSDIERKSVVFVGSPIIDNPGNLMGIFLLQLDTTLVKSFLSNTPFVKKFGEAYIIDSSGKPITSLKYGGGDLSQVYGEELDACHSNIGGGSGDYINYKNITVVGSYRKIPNTNWCLFVEIHKEYFLKEYFNLWNFGGWNGIYLGISLIIILGITGLIFDNYFYLKRGGK
ncbi:hypothetical protein KAS08_05460 [Candidatus Pacearchaeota archaeon]|nr:hypothetical protein [Candidatus Pacearchaeota archaeon]